MRSPRLAELGERKSESDASSDQADDGFFDRVANWADGVFGEKNTRALHFYKVPRMVRIRAAPLQIPKLAFELLATIGSLGWLVWNLHFLQQKEIVSHSAVLDLSFPQKNFDVCHDPDVDCDDVGAQQRKTPPYCRNETWSSLKENAHNYFFTDNHGDVQHEYSKARWNDTPSVEVRCRRFDHHDVYKSNVDGPLLATAITGMTQDRCNNKDCIWKNLDFELDFVFDAERFLFKVRHNVQTSDGAIFKNLDGTAFINIHGEKRVIRCDEAKEASGACKYDIESWKRDYPSCAKQEEECFSTGFADFLSLETLLQAANISMDDGISGGLPRRWWGTALALDIEYSNANPQDFWLHWPLGTHLVYTYSVRKIDDYVWQSEVHYLDDGKRRRLLRHSGINIVVGVYGTLAEFDAAYLLKVFAIFSVIFSLSVQFVDTFVLFLYKRLPFLKHIPSMHKFYQYKETPHHDLVKRLDAEGLAEKELLIRQQMLLKLRDESALSAKSSDEESSSR